MRPISVQILYLAILGNLTKDWKLLDEVITAWLGEDSILIYKAEDKFLGALLDESETP